MSLIRTLGVAAVAAAAVLSSACAEASPAEVDGVSSSDASQSTTGIDGRHGFHRFAILDLREPLGLTDEQVTSLEAIHEQARIQAEPILAEIRSIVGEPDSIRGRHRDRLAGLTDEQRARLRVLHESLQAIRATTHEQALAVLTDEQKQILDELRAEARERHGDRRRPPHGRRG